MTDVEGDLLTAILTPADHEGPELLADFSMTQCGITAEPGDILTVTPGKVTVRDLGVWTQEEIDEIMRRAREMHRKLFGKID